MISFVKHKNHLDLKPKELYLKTFFIALFASCVIFIPFMIMDSGYFIFYGDFNVQQIPFYQMCHEMIKTGNIAWNWQTDLGANFIGSYTFYLLGSPFFWVTLLFPNWVVPYLMGPLLIIKIALCALTAYAFIRRFTHKPQTAMLCALLYAFSGFSIYNIFFNHFHEALIFFPLLLLAVELYISENRKGVLAICVCLCAITNYFFFFGMVVFVLIYFFVRLLSGCWKLSFKRFAGFVFECILGVLIGSFILMPSIFAVVQNTRISEILLGWNAILYGKEQIYANIIQCFFFPPDIPARPVFFPNADVKWASLGGWLPLFSMTGVFAWMQAKKGHWLRRIIGIMIFMALVPVLNSTFYMCNQAYYARWFYMPVLMMCMATAMAIEDRSVSWKTAFKWTAIITVAIVTVIGFFPIKNEDGTLRFGLYTYEQDSNTYIIRFWTTCAIAVIGLVILGVLLTQLRTRGRAFLRSATAFVVVISVVYSIVFIATGKQHSFDEDTVMIPQLIEGRVDLPDANTNSYRVDVYDGVDNTGMYLGLQSINSFHSVVPSSIFDYYKYIGVSRDVASRPDTEHYVIRPFLSVKYVLNRTEGESFESEEGTKMPGYSYVTTTGGYNVYENQNYIPYGFTYEYYMDSAQCNYFGESKRENMMLKAILLDEHQQKKYKNILKNISEGYFIEEYNEEEPKEVVVFDNETLAKDCNKLKNTAATSFEVNNKGFVSKITLPKENLVFFSVPHDSGWTAYVNGQKVDIEKVNVGFMAVLGEAGENTIVFEYNTPGLSLGIKISIICLMVFVLYIIVFFVLKKRFPSRFLVEYPEGKQLREKFMRLDAWERTQQLQCENESEKDSTEEMFFEQMQDFPQNNAYSGFDGGFIVDENVFEEGKEEE